MLIIPGPAAPLFTAFSTSIPRINGTIPLKRQGRQMSVGGEIRRGPGFFEELFYSLPVAFSGQNYMYRRLRESIADIQDALRSNSGPTTCG